MCTPLCSLALFHDMLVFCAPQVSQKTRNKNGFFWPTAHQINNVKGYAYKSYNFLFVCLFDILLLGITHITIYDFWWILKTLSILLFYAIYPVMVVMSTPIVGQSMRPPIFFLLFRRAYIIDI